MRKRITRKKKNKLKIKEKQMEEKTIYNRYNLYI